jgi:YaaC-like Protein
VRGLFVLLADSTVWWMARLAGPRDGEVLDAKGRRLPFSYFPVTKGNRRYGLYDTVFAVSPWSVMRGEVSKELKAGQAEEALAFLRQAEDFHRAASSGVSTNPVLTYYSFVNLAKALIRVRGYEGSFDRAMHGMTEKTKEEGTELLDSTVVVKDNGSDLNIFPELTERLGYERPVHGAEYAVTELLPQMVVGHRIWRESGKGHTERFVDLKHIDFVEDRAAKELWLRLYVGRNDLSRYDMTRKRLLEEGDLDGQFQEVKTEGTDRSEEGAELVCLEQTKAVAYTGRPTDVVSDLVEPMKSRLWRIASSTPSAGYRRYYLHLTPPEEAGSRLPQLASMWALFFYFGSVVRYRPHLFDAALRGSQGAFVAEFVASQPDQMLYLLASELCAREVARPAIA